MLVVDAFVVVKHGDGLGDGYWFSNLEKGPPIYDLTPSYSQEGISFVGRFLSFRRGD